MDGDTPRLLVDCRALHGPAKGRDGGLPPGFTVGMRHPQAAYVEHVTTPALEPLVSITQAAELLGVSTRTVLRLADSRAIVRVRIGRRTLFEPDSIRDYRERQRERGSP